MNKREWKPIEGFDFKEILFDEYNGIARITINRPRWRNAFICSNCPARSTHMSATDDRPSVGVSEKAIRPTIVS